MQWKGEENIFTYGKKISVSEIIYLVNLVFFANSPSLSGCVSNPVAIVVDDFLPIKYKPVVCGAFP
jgi:Na+/H+ antiporter NhaD/arsenite permease-like protein